MTAGLPSRLQPLVTPAGRLSPHFYAFLEWLRDVVAWLEGSWVDVTARRFGAKGDGVADDLAAIQAAVDTGLSVYFPAGAYNVSGPVELANHGQRLFGPILGSATIRSTHASNAILHTTATRIEVANLAFAATVTRTAGAYLDIGTGSVYLHIHDIYMRDFFIGIVLQLHASSVRIQNAFLIEGVAGSSVGVQVLGGVDNVLRDVWIVGAVGADLGMGVQVLNAGDLTLDHVSTVYAGTGLAVQPGSGQVMQALVVKGCFFDSGDGTGILVQPSDGLVQSMRVSDTWSASNDNDGVLLNVTGSGAVQQADFRNSTFSNNVIAGVRIASASVSYVTIEGCSCSANGTGLLTTATTAWLMARGCTFGPTGQFAGNTEGVNLTSGMDYFNLSDNRIAGNLSADLIVGTPAGAWGETVFAARNIGAVTQSSGVLVTTAGPTTFAVTHGLAVTPALEDIRLTLLSGPGAAASFYAVNATATTFDVVFSSAPGAGVNIGWGVRSWGA